MLATPVGDPGDSEQSEAEGYVVGDDDGRCAGEACSGDNPANAVNGVEHSSGTIHVPTSDGEGSGDTSAPHDPKCSGDAPASIEELTTGVESPSGDDVVWGTCTQLCIPLPDINRRVDSPGISGDAPANPYVLGGSILSLEIGRDSPARPNDDSPPPPIGIWSLAKKDGKAPSSLLPFPSEMPLKLRTF